MPSRADMDRPASVTAAILGVVLIAITLPYFILGGAGGGGSAYDISWTAVTTAEGQAQSGAANTDTVVTVTVSNQVPARAVIEFDPCTDAGGNAVQPAATVTWTLREGSRQIGDGTASCANNGPSTVEIEAQPDTGQADGDGAQEAARSAYGSENRTATYTLTFRWTRAAPPAPLPLPAAAFSTTAHLEIQVWRATANTPDPEAPR
jgi:hypothetical protein